MAKKQASVAMATREALSGGADVVREIAPGVSFRFREAKWKHYTYFVTHIDPLLNAASENGDGGGVAGLLTNRELLEHQVVLLRDLVAEPDLSDLEVDELESWSPAVVIALRPILSTLITASFARPEEDVEEDPTPTPDSSAS